jgi:hypothetical protein
VVSLCNVCNGEAEEERQKVKVRGQEREECKGNFHGSYLVCFNTDCLQNGVVI